MSYYMESLPERNVFTFKRCIKRGKNEPNILQGE